MKVSSARLERALQLRDAAVRVLNHIGYDVIAGSEGGYCHYTRQAKLNDLTILYSRRRHLIDVWQGEKVFSITWIAAEGPNVRAFRSGNWERVLLNTDAELTWTSVKCSPELKRWLRVGSLTEDD